MSDASSYLESEGIGRRDLLRRTAIGGGLVVAALATPGLTGTAKAHPLGGKRIILDVDTHGFADFQATGDDGTGAFYVSGDINAGGGNIFGTNKIGLFQCWGFIPASKGDPPVPQDAVVNQEFQIRNRGKILIAGRENESKRAVTGGTNDFRVASGDGKPDLTTFDFANTGRFRIDFQVVGGHGAEIG